MAKITNEKEFNKCADFTIQSLAKMLNQVDSSKVPAVVALANYLDVNLQDAVTLQKTAKKYYEDSEGDNND